MTYNHERAKVLCPEAAAEVERLRDSEPVRCIAVQVMREATGCQDMIGRNGESIVETIAERFAEYAKAQPIPD